VDELANSSPLLGERRFGAMDQARFAALSGDRNPLHLDPVAARRTQAGAPAVHGMHAVLWGLETLAKAGLWTERFGTLRVRFRRFISLDRDVRLDLVRPGVPLRVVLVADGATTTTLELAGGPCAPAGPLLSGRDVRVQTMPLELAPSDLAGRSGCIAAPPLSGCIAYFPHLAARIGAGRVASLVRLSALVGMVCPGLYSIFDGFEIRLTPDNLGSALSFRVREVDERFRMVRLEVAGGGIAGVLTALMRHPPVAQPSLAAVAPWVRPGEFAAVTALVIGGSRGLGAVTARLIAAGGGRVAITYAQGEQDARGVAADIGPRACRWFQYDARAPAAPQLARLGWMANQLFYFATPRIFRQKPGVYARSLFDEFRDIYVDGFAAASTALQAQTGRPLAVFYPSSVAVAERPPGMTEYAMAKAAGEILCADLQQSRPGLWILVARLPRLLTDQTAAASVMPGAAGAEGPSGEDAVRTMLPILRAMRAGCHG
jgi:hypothetical protein